MESKRPHTDSTGGRTFMGKNRDRVWAGNGLLGKMAKGQDLG